VVTSIFKGHTLTTYATTGKNNFAASGRLDHYPGPQWKKLIYAPENEQAELEEME
jgi:hypothetical protein